ncbi:hypothetical protein AAL_05521 [Moelleriella libera RCEF 2490]|uniref:Uncharacterized protein n=1 Tax=Moelleriella libera RCEF 2490 TaxID=1081109 RepID=A0A168ADU2_9HYPO|nr:hypothetical protein AAL_05521 [Moelleriella libera RCEF 2490]
MLYQRVLLVVALTLTGYEAVAQPTGIKDAIGSTASGAQLFARGRGKANGKAAGSANANANAGAGGKANGNNANVNANGRAAGGAAGKAAGGAAGKGRKNAAPASGGARGGGGGGGGGRGQPSAQQIDNAQRAWQADTATVSKFLSTAEGMSGRELQKQASVALAAEKDELTHKGVLDRMFLQGNRRNRDASVAQANQVLDTQGTFQFVVDGLDTLTKRGAKMSPQQVSAMVRSINDDRCPQVLPNIDRYLAAAGNVVQSGETLQAIRPNNC